jgi:nickel/cobalt transporter (NicO) family protein
MKRVLLATCIALVLPAAAQAHPLGNFSVNHQARIAIAKDRVDVTYVLDQAEIPTFQERGRAPAAVLADKRAEVERGLRLEVDGRAVQLRLAPGGRISFPPGQGGLKTTRVELHLSAAVAGHAVRLRDDTFADRRGYAAVVARPGRGTAVRSSVPASDPTDALRRYPAGKAAGRREATFSVRPGHGTVTAPDGEVELAGREDGFAGLLGRSGGLSLVLLLAAFGWGALHALSPGHGKAMVAAYLVGTRGRARHAVALGATVTVTHTIGVFALGAITLALSQYVLPETLYPWLNLVSGLLVVGIGATVLRGHLRRVRAARGRHEDHAHVHELHHGHDHGHGHSHLPRDPGVRGLLGMGAAAGLIPCPSALVVLLAAISLHRVAFGLVLIIAFSIGLATTITGIGLVAVYARRLFRRASFEGRLVRLLPALSALVIVAVGIVMTVRALPHVVA